ncbi:hypothetical protein IPU70_00655 [Achromobacter sp. SD115]|uniref:hypothetical protein n=1 Tax=Achromobacter sp. SD115 TaxID=2782011 RepID=UPI001A96C7EE|nr:hypothetical protein [Achromobacter sp. SD115]MBO1012037.1 hypothetical protein [Achromobacter sp. SD115]
MPKYYKSIIESTTISRRTGTGAVIPIGFRDLSASIVSSCTFLQSLLQQIIYVTHGAELIAAKRALKEFPNPKARIDFLCSFPYSEADPVVLSVFDYARLLFRDLYELRNILSHEVWASSDDYDDAVIFSSLDEEARLLMVSGRMWHMENVTSQEVFDATVRYIRSVKIVASADLNAAMGDANWCSWILVHISNVLNEQDAAKKAEARQLFLKAKGTSHLFAGTPPITEPLNFNVSMRKTIKG